MGALLETYRRLPISFSHGLGAWLWDDSGRAYLDALSGIAVTNLGHAHPRLLRVLQEQAAKLWHCSNLYEIPAQEALAERLGELSQLERVFFANSGAEANEAAFKIMRRYGLEQGIQEPKIVVAEYGFHGRTFATLSASGPKIRAGFAPLVPGFVRVPFDDFAALEALAHNTPDIVAVWLEPIQGEGGIRVPSPGYLRRVRQLCFKHNWLLALDEVQTGLGRTGYWWAHQAELISPDILVIAKGLANGLPIGACLIKERFASLLQPGSHGSTFGGNPLIARVALETLNIIENDALIAHIELISAFLLDAFKALAKRFDFIVDVRGCGFMFGIELDHPCRDILHCGLAEGLLFNITQERVLRFLPPFILSRDEASQLVERLERTFNRYDSKPRH